MVLLGLTPLFAVYLAGAVIWLVKSPAWLQAGRGQAVLMLLAAMALSLMSGVALLGWRRRQPLIPAPAQASRRAGLRAVAARAGVGGAAAPTSITMVLVLVLLPLWRGPARRSGRLWLAGLLVLLACAGALALWPRHGAWWLAAFGLLAQLLVSRLQVLVATELGALHAACAALPITARWLRNARHALVMVPVLAGQVGLLTALAWAGLAVRAPVLAAYLILGFFGNLALILTSSVQRPGPASEEAAARVSWWLFLGVLSLALASEVFI